MDLSYKIIGGDEHEYGPVSLVELKAWVVDGRVTGPTQVWRSDSAEWSPAIQYAELHPEIGQVTAAVAPMYLVGFWPRFGAYVLDSIVLAAVYCLVLEPTKLNLATFNPANVEETLALLKSLSRQVAVQYSIEMIYCVLMTGAFGATLGKMAIRARIVQADGRKLGYGRAWLRWAGTVLSRLTLFIGYLMIAWREDKCALHDLMAGTRVVYRPEPLHG
jgi:uncharacterized RDD family membrane protein YckC